MATVLSRPTPTPVRGTPAIPDPGRTRDGFVDALRAVGTLCVVALHWLMAEAAWDGHTLRIGNALAHGDAWVLTWVMQVLPLLFFAAGAAAAYQHAGLPDRGARTWAQTMGRRVRGVARPVGAFAVCWALAGTLLVASGVPGGAVRTLVLLAPQPLWFLAVWLVLVALAPLLLRAWRRWRWRALAVALVAPLVVDALRFAAGLRPIAWANVLLVWAVPFLAGLGYADDRVTGRPVTPRPALWAGLLAGVGSMVLLVGLGPYPRSMVGMPGDAISNLNPPTAPIVAQAVAQVCAALLAGDALRRWARGSGRGLVTTLNRRSLTVYVWHLSAVFVVVGVDLLVLHEKLPTPWDVDWWASRPEWFGGYGLVLVVLVRTFGRLEVSRSGRRVSSG